MQSLATEDGVVLHQLQAIGSILAVLLGNVAGSSRHAGLLVLRTLQDDLYAIAFALLSHDCVVLCEGLELHARIHPFAFQFLQIGINAQFVDRANGLSRYL